MTEKERLTFQRKHELAQKYGQLNELLAQKKQLNDRIADLAQEMNGLRRQVNKIDEKFSKLVIEVEPTETVTLKKDNSKVKKVLRDKILKKVSEGNVTTETIEELLNLYKK